MILYRELITNALKLSWRYKFLWGLALFAALAGNGGEYEILFSGSDSLSGQSYLIGFLRAIYADGTFPRMIMNIGDFFGAYPLPSIFLTLLIIVVFLLVVWLVIVAQAGLIAAIAQLRGKTQMSFHDAFSAGSKYFSPVFLINAFAKIIVYGIVLLIAVPFGMQFIKTGVAFYNSAYVMISYIALIPVSIILSFIVKYASAYIVLRNQPWKLALKNGWRLFIKNWLTSLEVALLLFAINLIASLILIFLLLLLGLASNPAGLVVFYALLTGMGVFVATFQNTVWVNIFLELEKGGIQSKLLRWSNALLHRTPPTPNQPPTA